MRELLTTEPDQADALVDLSYVLRNQRLGGRGAADLVRLERVGAALALLYGAARVSLYCVADESILKRELLTDPAQRRTLRGWAEEGLLLMVGKADIPLLQIAAETGLPIITGDRFGGHRREFPWLDGSDDTILEPYADQRGEVLLRHVTLLAKEEWEMSVSEEHDLLVQQGLTEQIEALGRWWGCPERRCPRHDPRRSPFVLLPRGRGGRLICDLHGLDMLDLGPRPRAAQLKVMKDSREVARFTVAQGTPVTVGRSPGPADLTPHLDEEHLRKVSRAHLRFELDADRLTVTDLSRNGTVLVLRDGTELELRHGTRSFSKDVRARIVTGLEIIRSGRRYPSELTLDREAARARTEPPEPTLFA